MGGVFHQNYPDGRGTCVSANPVRACHKTLAEYEWSDPDYLAELTLTPPVSSGSVEAIGLEMIRAASNQQCWHLPPDH
ncbi:hypothetical protein IU450_36140 [Nocardia abscessus]|uniref:hypothetical protein n=1 Tax=Nocardia abscessus TaxID=120957 RepID=UPI001894A87E|nr:hypothetical protein [Nocardia abscessus]MBF6341273.1 hypothetical protein [Nocardia abscessus]